MHGIERLGIDGSHHLRPLTELTTEHGIGHRRRTRPIARLHLARRHVEHHRHARCAMTGGHLAGAGTSGNVVPERIDHGGQPSSEPTIHHVVEHGERIGGDAQVVFSLAHQPPQRVARDHMAGEVLGRPGGLARSGRADQHDEAG